MTRLPRPRKTANLSVSVHRQLNAYALAAGAAGAGMLALTQPAEAKIVYTPAHKSIPLNGHVPLDLNHDGITDFRLNNIYTSTSGKEGVVWVAPKRSANEVWAVESCTTSGILLCAAALPKDTKIGPKRRFLPDYPDGELMAASGSRFDHGLGAWFNVTRYLGLKFVIKGTVHFGWARVKVVAPKFPSYKFKATLLG